MKLFGRHMPIALAEQKPRQGQALARGPQARCAQAADAFGIGARPAHETDIATFGADFQINSKLPYNQL
ncbi:MAG: hypothetical protein NTY59_03615 [Alphaproteobacteria bacterium]|nr:hypothetical protein [Alphaproteobacteria bacterium]